MFPACATRTMGLLVVAFCASGCIGLRPSNYRDWSPDQAVLPYAEFSGDRVRVHNIRNCAYLTDEQYAVEHYDRTFDLERIDSVDFLVVPFKETPSMAHTMLSFAFRDGGRLAVSVEIRRERGEKYGVAKALLRQYEIMYVLGDERDLIRLRTNYRKDEVYLYRARATPEQARELLVDILQRVNRLHEQPEFYDLFTNNCTTNIMEHVNHLAPSRSLIPYGWQVLLPGYSDRLAYDLGLLDTALPFEETKRRARITEVAQRVDDAPDFSERIRRF